MKSLKCTIMTFPPFDSAPSVAAKSAPTAPPTTSTPPASAIFLPVSKLCMISSLFASLLPWNDTNGWLGSIALCVACGRACS